jgi:SAM-dependent MidA family methyltransferase
MTPLEEIIRKEIRRSGPLPFRRFMELALYHPRHGYYRRAGSPFGRQGDFFTNSQLQPVFGRLIAQQIERWRTELGEPVDFTVVDFGAGIGHTLTEVRRHLPGAGFLAVEHGEDDLPETFTGVVYANELMDALPVHVVRRRGGALKEEFVDAGPSGLTWREDDLSDARLARFVERFAPGLAEGRRLEVNLDGLAWLDHLHGSLQRGFVLLIDYGYTAAEIAGGRRFPEGSLLSYERHQVREEVLHDPGGRDITAHVNFTALEEHAREIGFSSQGLKTQARFLLEIGHGDEFARALAANSEQEASQLRLQLKTLLFGMGETFRVLVLRK